MKALFLLALLLNCTARAAVVGAGDLAWETFHDDGLRIMKYNRESLDQNQRSYQARVWLYTRFKTPFTRAETDGMAIKYVFQHVIFDCMDRSYAQTEMLVFDWENEENVGHLLSKTHYSIVAGSPMDRLWGVACTFPSNHQSIQ